MDNREILELLDVLRDCARRFGHGSWRLPDDVVEAAYDRLVDMLLRRDQRISPSRRIPFATAVLKNFVRSGPPRLGLDRGVTGWLHCEPVDPGPNRAPRVARPATIPTGAVDRLTPAERTALEALLTAPTMRAAAAAAHMSPRDLRTRFRRIARKIREHLDEDGSNG